MDIQKTMEFILEQQAKTEANLAAMATKMSERETVGAATDRRLDRLERSLARLARLGVRSRSNINRRMDEYEQYRKEHAEVHRIIDQNLREITDKLNGLIDVVDRWPCTQ